MLKKIIKAILKIIGGICVLGIIGSVGSCELFKTTVGEMFIQCGISSILLYVIYKLYQVVDNF